MSLSTKATATANNAQGEDFPAFWERMGSMSPHELYNMCRESTVILNDLKRDYKDIISSLIKAHDLDIATDPDTEQQARKLLENIVKLSLQPWNLDDNEREEDRPA